MNNNKKGLVISSIATIPAICLLINVRYLMIDFIEEKQVVILADTYILYLLPSVFVTFKYYHVFVFILKNHVKT